MRLSFPLCVCAALLAFVAHPLYALEPREAGFNELIVIDPGQQENGLPTAVLSNGQVDIPPTLHVHPYFYSGDKEYQGPILNGGPTIVVAKHPKSGEKLYIDAILPAGAPIIAYRDDAITYIYQDRRVVVEFHAFQPHRATVKYVGGRGALRKLSEKVQISKANLAAMSRRSRLVTEVKKLSADTGNLLKGSAGVVENIGAVAVERTRAVTKFVPGVQLLQSAGEQADERGATEEVRQAAFEQVQNEVQFGPTVR
ncbi:MAG: hypothetical protein KDA69_02250 [Planctomycetaceae bacterium]|nr:hypothetical protein [Planctomycetaceae bacterium]MCA9043109.1 hypothetical protein [Planctomycetaceae bacterium]MCB9951959.1 hypothetical protein [Planctomycetaceae bacterium]